MKNCRKVKCVALMLLNAWLLPGTLQAAAPGNALSFDGADDYVSIADANDLDLTNNYTLECWFKADSFGSGGFPSNLRGLISKYQSSGANGYFLRLRGTELEFDGTYTSGLNLQNGTWYHVAAVNDNGTRRLYLNGVDKTSLLTGSPSAVQANTNALTLASDYLADSNRFFDGRMDEVRVWNDVRTVTEINDNRNKELVGNESNLVAYYSCNETSGTSLPDVTVPSNNHTGTLMNGPAWVISTIFGGVSTATVTATASGTGSGSVSSNIGGISYSYPTTGTGTTTAIEYGTDVVLTANAASGSTVTWTATGGTIGGTSTSATCTFSNLAGNKTAAATFTLIPVVNLYVDRAATGANNGTSWANAFTNLQDALAAPTKGTIYVARGTYKPTTGADRAATFQLKTNVTLQGGYPTGGGSRDPKTHVTILSGDLLGNDNGNLAYGEPTLSDNSYTVVTGSGTDSTAILDGFTISGGNADNWDTSGWHGANGAGMYNDNGSPAVRNVTFANNKAYQGAGMYNTGSAPDVTGVTFSNNYAGAGAGIYNTGSTPSVTDVSFTNNSAEYGAGMYNLASSPALRNVTFTNNSVNNHGAGMYNKYASSPGLTNVTFSGNSAYSGGGIMNVGADDNPVLMNVTFSNNSGSGMYNNASTPTLTNCILWGNSPDQFRNENGSTPTVTYSVVQGGYTGTGNLSADPLLGPLGNYGGYTQTIPLLTGSPAINAATATGAPATDQRGTARPKGAGYDIGAFELDTTAASPPTVTSIVANSAYPVASINVTINGTNFSGAPAVLIRKTGFATITATNVVLVSSARLTCTLDIYGEVAGARDVAVFNPDGRNCVLTNGFTVLDVPRGNVYVDKNRSGGNHDGTSWANAFTDLAGILPSTRSGDTIHVAQGTYKPTPGADRTKTFPLNDGVTLLGGYPTGGAGSRDPKTYPAILTGDLLGNDNNVIASDEPTRAENSYSVVTRSGAYGNNATLDGFTVTGGNANSESGDGGGLCNASNANLTLANVTFRNNSASDYGGGLYNESDGTLAMTNVTFSNNSADYGGGLYTDYSTNSLTNVTFSGNSAYQGGGLHTYSGTSTLTNVTVSGNSASDSGGGLFLGYCTLTMSNSMVWGNSPDGIYNGGSTITVTYSVVQGNLYSGAGNLNTDPFLGPLGDFGGYTQTIPLLPGSPAINAGTATGAPATDQRGIARPQGAGYDIGAFEKDSTTAPQPTVTSITPASAARSAALSVTIHGTNFSGTPVVLLQKGGNANIVATNVSLVNSTSLTCTFNTLGVNAGTWNVVVLNQDGRSGALANGFEIPYVNIYVDRNNSGGTHNGTSWATAFLDLAAVLASSQKGDIIHVAKGTYKPTTDTDRMKTFQLKSGVSLLGGYPTGGGTRDSKTNVTILSGDIGTTADMSDNSYNVVTGSGTDGTASLDGFTISGGNASGYGDGEYCVGGGMYNNDGSPTINEVTFSGNRALNYGGGLYNESGSPALTNVTFSNNTALS
ncbi:MAG: IPT/TIG domain-containing protein [Verrucomicrobia bacterium]|nr:IPT/TIG domain-containing protein [Verrucomicrobiota bacterium]